MADDRDLLAALRAGSPAAFRQLFETYSDRMFRLAAGMLRDEGEAEDVVQDAFLRFIENLDTFKGRSQVGTWLYRTVHNASVDRMRRRQPSRKLAPEDLERDAALMPAILTDWGQNPAALVARGEVQEKLDEAIASLSEGLRAVFLLRDVEELSTAETAHVLEISESAVKVRLHRARLELRERLAEYFAEPAH